MIYLKCFIFCGLVCGLSQLLLEKTRYTPGHINTILVIIGCALSSFGIYDILLSEFHSGASVLITNFGHLLVTGAYEGFMEYGFVGLFKGVLSYASCGLSVTIVSAFIVSILFKVRN